MPADPIIYCLENLTDYDQFERFCHDLMAAQGYAEIEPLGGHKDKGRDALHVCRTPSGRITTVFAYSVREDWRRKLDEDCRKILEHRHECDRVTFVCTARFTVAERDDAVRHIREKYGWELELYGLERLRVLLSGAHSKLVARHPQIFCPPFFPQAGGVSLTFSRDYLVIDFADPDEPLASWLARRLILAGYCVWCKSIAPIGGASLAETIELLIQQRAFRFLPILSPEALADPDLAARRSLASRIDKTLVLPIVARSIDHGLLDEKTRSLESVRFDDSWARGLARTLDVLSAARCPRSTSGSEITLRSYVPEDVVSANSEHLYSNRFRILRLPEVVLRFKCQRPPIHEALTELRFKWPCRRVDPYRFLAFQPPPDEIAHKFGFHESGGASWKHVKDIDGIATDHLVPELVRKSVEAEFIKRGLKYCDESRLLYFPSGLLPSDRLYFTKPDGSRTHVSVAGRRTYYPRSIPYRYHLAPAISVKFYPAVGLAVTIRLRLRLTDGTGMPLTGRAVSSRRKHLCKDWWNDNWFHRILAVMQFLTDGGDIRIGATPEHQIVISASPDSWQVPVRIDEELIRDAPATRGEILAYDDDEDNNSAANG